MIPNQKGNSKKTEFSVKLFSLVVFISIFLTWVFATAFVFLQLMTLGILFQGAVFSIFFTVCYLSVLVLPKLLRPVFSTLFLIISVPLVFMGWSRLLVASIGV